MMGKAVVFSVYKDNRHESCRLFMMMFISETNSLPVGAVGGLQDQSGIQLFFCLIHIMNKERINSDI